MSGDYSDSILQKSVIPNLLQETFQPTFMTEIEDEGSRNVVMKQNNVKNNISEQSHHEEIDKRAKFKGSIDFRKTLGFNNFIDEKIEMIFILAHEDSFDDVTDVNPTPDTLLTDSGHCNLLYDIIVLLGAVLLCQHIVVFLI